MEDLDIPITGYGKNNESYFDWARCGNCASWSADGTCKERLNKTDYNGNCATFSPKQEEITENELREAFELIIKILKKYCQLQHEFEYQFIAIWILGTYMHKEFITYPYLFFNATKGSGKTRLLKLIAELSYKGKLVGDMREAVLFRTAKDSTICIDEFESIASKDKGALRELLNAGYKQGMAVERSKKVNVKGTETYVVEKFDVFCPIAMANIFGMVDVLDDRCISIVLEKSQSLPIIKKVEAFNYDEDIVRFHEIMDQFILKRTSSVVSVVYRRKNIYREWNNYIDSVHVETTLTTYNTYTTLTTLTTLNNKNDNNYILFKKIDSLTLDGRHLELFFPTFLISSEIGDDILGNMLIFSESIVSEKRESDAYVNMDVSLMDYLAHCQPQDYVFPKELAFEFSNFIDHDVNTKWLGRALKRLNLVLEKVRLAKGYKVKIDYSKAMNKTIFLSKKPLEPAREEKKVIEEKLL